MMIDLIDFWRERAGTPSAVKLMTDGHMAIMVFRLSLFLSGAVQLLRNAPGEGGGRPSVTLCDRGRGGGSGRALRNA